MFSHDRGCAEDSRTWGQLSNGSRMDEIDSHEVLDDIMALCHRCKACAERSDDLSPSFVCILLRKISTTIPLGELRIEQSKDGKQH